MVIFKVVCGVFCVCVSSGAAVFYDPGAFGEMCGGSGRDQRPAGRYQRFCTERSSACSESFLFHTCEYNPHL